MPDNFTGDYNNNFQSYERTSSLGIDYAKNYGEKDQRPQLCPDTNTEKSANFPDVMNTSLIFSECATGLVSR